MYMFVISSKMILIYKNDLDLFCILYSRMYENVKNSNFQKAPRAKEKKRKKNFIRRVSFRWKHFENELSFVLDIGQWWQRQF